MAIGIQNYPNVSDTNGAYPNGDIRDRSGATNGTPVNRRVYADMHQFFAKLMRIAGITPNGNPENETNGFQYITALGKSIENFFSKGVIDQADTTKKILHKKIDIGVWNMVATATISVAHGVSNFDNILDVSVFIKSDTSPGFYRKLDNVNHNNPLPLAAGGSYTVGAGLITLDRVSGGSFDDTLFNDATMNRGKIFITYYE